MSLLSGVVLDAIRWVSHMSTKLRVEKRKCWSEDERGGTYEGEFWGFIDGGYFYTFRNFESAIYHATQEYLLDDCRYSGLIAYDAYQTDRVAGRNEHGGHIVDNKLCEMWEK